MLIKYCSDGIMQYTISVVYTKIAEEIAFKEKKNDYSNGAQRNP